jgi:hypothetical protein
MAPVLADDHVVEAARVDARPRARRLLPPVLTLVGSGAALTYLAAVDPNEPGHYPLCPTRALLGIDCPGCGILRGTHDLVTGNVGAALDNNLMLAILAPLAVVLWVRWVIRSWRGTSPELTYRQFRRRNAWIIAGVVALVVFGVVRNLTPWLGSGVG